MIFLRKNIYYLLALIVGVITFSCKSGSFIKRKYLIGNYITFSGKHTEPRVNEISGAKVIPNTIPFVASIKNENFNAHTIVCNNESVELNLSKNEGNNISRKNIAIKKQNEDNINKIKLNKYRHLPFPFLSDDDPIAKKTRILFFISLGIIVLVVPILFLLGMYSSIDGFILLIILAIGLVTIGILSIIRLFLNIRSWREGKN